MKTNREYYIEYLSGLSTTELFNEEEAQKEMYKFFGNCLLDENEVKDKFECLNHEIEFRKKYGA